MTSPALNIFIASFLTSVATVGGKTTAVYVGKGVAWGVVKIAHGIHHVKPAAQAVAHRVAK